MPITDRELQAIVTGVVAVVGEECSAIRQTCADLEATIADLRAELGALQTKAEHHLTYKGTWTAAEIYEPGDVCTRNGSLWHCTAKHASASFEHRYFRLMAKSGEERRPPKDERRTPA
jgi:hypothetical protein